jgi:hypothetical protein
MNGKSKNRAHRGVLSHFKKHFLSLNTAQYEFTQKVYFAEREEGVEDFRIRFIDLCT